MNTLIVNFFAGAGAGKSTLSADVFAELKWHGVNAEYVPEFAKDAVWEGREKVFTDQSYIYGKQHFRITRLIGEVDVIITDSPILLSAFYNKNLGETFNRFVIENFKKHNNLNYFVNRVKPYNPKGRLETEDQAKENDRKLKDLLIKHNIPFVVIDGRKESVPVVTEQVLRELRRKGNIK